MIDSVEGFHLAYISNAVVAKCQTDYFVNSRMNGDDSVEDTTY